MDTKLLNILKFTDAIYASSCLENFSVKELRSVASSKDSSRYYGMLSRFIAPFVCNFYDIDVVNREWAYIHWMSDFIKWRNMLLSNISNSEAKNIDAMREDVCVYFKKLLDGNIGNKDSIKYLWKIFISNEIKNHKNNKKYSESINLMDSVQILNSDAIKIKNEVYKFIESLI